MTNKILLVSANFCTEPYPVYPLGMALVARALVNAGHEVAQFDPLLHAEWEQELCAVVREFAPSCVGVSLRNIDNVDSLSADTHWWVRSGKTIVDVVKSLTNAPVVMGGAGFSLLPDAILDYVGADYGIAGEGEVAFPALVEKLGRGETPPRMTRSFDTPLEPKDFLFPLYDQKIAAWHADVTGFLNFQTKRGCPYSCAYCTYPCLEGNKFRGLEALEVSDNLERMVRDTGVGEVFFTDSVFNDPRGDYLVIAEEMIRRKLNVKWCGYFRPSGMGLEEIRLLKRAGLFAMELGTDATTDATLKGLGKGFTFDEARRVSDLLAGEEIAGSHFVIFGGPGETPQTVEEGLANLETLKKTVVFAFVGIRILPGTKVYELALKEGDVTPENDLLRPAFYHSKAIDPKVMTARLTEAFRGKRDRVFPPDEGQARMSVMRRFGFKGILWDRLIDFRPKAGA